MSTISTMIFSHDLACNSTAFPIILQFFPVRVKIFPFRGVGFWPKLILKGFFEKNIAVENPRSINQQNFNWKDFHLFSDRSSA